MPVDNSIRKVVFVCAHGAAKSVLAGSYFNHLARQHGLNARAVARGTEPDDAVSERVRMDLSATALELCTTTPERLTDADVAAADLLITFDVSIDPRDSTAHESWNGLPALSEQFDHAKQAIIAHVEDLVATLRKRPDQPRTH